MIFIDKNRNIEKFEFDSPGEKKRRFKRIGNEMKPVLTHKVTKLV
jgi:hypothetical protein